MVLTRRLDSGRREELLDGVMGMISVRGFSKLRTAELARGLHCSEATLYKIAPSKDSLIVLALSRWGDLVLERCEGAGAEATTAAEGARRYYRVGALSLRPLSHAFRRDVEQYESTRRAYREISGRFVNRFAELIEEAVQAGEIQRVNPVFTAGMFRHIASAIRDEDLLEAAGLTASEALLEVETVIWDGLTLRPGVGQGPGGR